MGIADVVTLLGGIALFLFGMSLMGEGLKKVAGSKLELVLYRLSSTPLKGVLLGTGVTAVIQSSSATSVMVVGFVNSGMMKVRQAIGVIMGAILGTSITGWILCLSSISGGSARRTSSQKARVLEVLRWEACRASIWRMGPGFSQAASLSISSEIDARKAVSSFTPPIWAWTRKLRSDPVASTRGRPKKAQPA